MRSMSVVAFMSPPFSDKENTPATTQRRQRQARVVVAGRWCFKWVLCIVFVLLLRHPWLFGGNGLRNEGESSRIHGTTRRLAQNQQQQQQQHGGTRVDVSLSTTRHLEQTITYTVPILLALYYLDNTTANLLVANSTSAVSQYFFSAVNLQAGGVQVNKAAEPYGATFVTHTKTISSSNITDYQCSIVQCRRWYNDLTSIDLFGPGYLVLELHLEQIVHVTWNDTVGSSQLVQDLVKRGFDRGYGGRVKFRTLLQQYPAFWSLIDVEVMQDWKTTSVFNTSTPSTRTPSVTPTTWTPTRVPTTVNPSMTPSLRYSMSPSEADTDVTTEPPSKIASSDSSIDVSSIPPDSSTPTTASPEATTGLPSLTTFTLPPLQLIATAMPTRRPVRTIAPTATTTNDRGGSLPQAAASSNGDNQDTRPLIFGAIAGGIATILVSCFFIFCVWFPFCTKKRRNNPLGGSDRSDGSSSNSGVGGFRRYRPRRDRRRLTRQNDVSDADKESNSSSASPKAFSVVPGVVQLDEENQSLANTSIGDYTVGIGLQQSTNLLAPPKKRRVVEADTLLGSFDESSLYTSNSVTTSSRRHQKTSSDGFPASSHASSSMVLPPSLNRALDFEEDIVFPMSSSSASSSEEGTSGSADAVLSTGSAIAALMRRNGGPVDVDEVSATSRPSDFYATPRAAKSLEASTEESKQPSPESATDTISRLADTILSSSDKAVEVSLSIDAAKNGLDPFSDENESSSKSSFGFRNAAQRELAFRDFAVASSSASTTADKTRARSNRVKRAESLLLRLSAVDKADRISSSEEAKVEDGSHESTEKSTATVISKQVSRHSQSPEAKDYNNSLLRTVLEDARRRAKARASSTKSWRSGNSRKSGKSAPTVMHAPATQTQPLASFSPASDILVDNNDLREQHTPVTRAAVKPSPETTTSKELDGAKAESDEPVSSHQTLPAYLPYRTRFLGKSPVVAQHHYMPSSSVVGSMENKMEMRIPPSYRVRNDNNTNTQENEVPSSPEMTPMPSPNGTLGAYPRDDVWNTLLEDQKLSDTPMSSPGMLGITSHPSTASKVIDDLSSDSEGLSNPWLFDTIESTLGPRSANADLESMSGYSVRSGKSHKSHKSHRSIRSQNSATSGKSRNSRASQRGHKSAPGSTQASIVHGSKEEEKIDFEHHSLSPSALELNLKRLEKQLAALSSDSEHLTNSTAAASSTSQSRPVSRRKMSTQKRIVVIVPPGKLGVVLANRHDGKGTVVSEVRSSSAMKGMLSPGDKLIAVDGQDVTGMVVKDITSLVASKSHLPRHLTVLTSRGGQAVAGLVPPQESDIIESYES